MSQNKRGYQKTWRGKVIYPEKRVKVFDGKAMIRIMMKVHNERLGDFVQWRAVLRLAQQNCEALQEIDNAEKIKQPEWIKTYREFLILFDKVVDLATSLLGDVPGAGWLLEAAATLYRGVRTAFPI